MSAATIDLLSRTHILIAGVGGTGGQCAIDLVRMGFGALTLADFDVYERHNINPQIGAFESTLGQPKIEVVAKMCRDINPAVRLRKVPEGIAPSNILELLTAGDLPAPAFVVEVIDISGVEAKLALYRACREQGISALTGLMVGLGAALHVFHPGSARFEDVLIDEQGRLALSRLVPQLGGYMQKDIVDACMAGRGHAPTCVIGATTASSLIVSEILRGLMLGKEAMIGWPQMVYVDHFDGTHVRGTWSKPEPK